MHHGAADRILFLPFKSLVRFAKTIFAYPEARGVDAEWMETLYL